MKKLLSITTFVGFMIMLFGAACADGSPMAISICIIALGIAMIAISAIVYKARYGETE